MDGNPKDLFKILNLNDTVFTIPIFQRNYAWSIKNCEQLYNDLIKITEDKRIYHFFGSIVSVSTNNGEKTEYQIIDGQQRITTTTLLLLAICNLIKKGIVSPKDCQEGDKIWSHCLVDTFSNNMPKLHLNKKDSKAFEALFDEQVEHVKTSNLTDNYNYFYKRIQKDEITIDQLISAIKKLKVINIIVDPQDNPQLIFESLNSTGLGLSESDKVRNYLLMNLSPEDQEQKYNTYWQKIEDNTDCNLDKFIRDYLSVKQSKAPTENKVYFEFKKYVNGRKLPATELLPELRNYSRFYKILLGYEKTNDRCLDACIFRLNWLETAATRPFFLEVFRIQNEGIITKEEMLQIFRYTENYIGRRLVCDLRGNALNKIFLRLHKEIGRFDGTFENYLEKFKYALLTKQEGGRFPDDKEFSNAFSTRRIYKSMELKRQYYILEQIENYETNEYKDVYQHLESHNKKDKYTIEHIMPQNLTSDWERELGPDFEKIHKTWVHRIANLTLTAYNPTLSNLSFKEKCNLREGGYSNSRIHMNHQIAQNKRWGKDELEKRDKELITKALKIWERPQTDYKPPQNELETECYTLEDDDVDLKGKKLEKYVYKEVEYPVKDWSVMYENVLKQLYSDHQAGLNQLVQNKGKGEYFSVYFSNDPNKFKVNFDIDHHIYCQKTTNTTTKQRILRYLFELFEIDLDKLEFHIRNKSKNKDIND